MKNLRRYRSVALASWLAAGLAAVTLASCANGPLGPLEPIPGNGPGGKPMPTSTDIVAGLPATPSTQLVYPITAKVDVSDDYNGKKVEDPYRWLEDLSSKPTQDWVAAQNRLSQPQLEAAPQREWAKERLTKLWNFERFNTPVKEGGRYFFLRNDGRQNQSVLFVSERLDEPGRVLFDPNAVRADATVALADSRRAPRAMWSRTRCPMAVPTGRSGASAK